HDPEDLNRYTYANNNPLIYTDPTGHFSFNIGKFFRRALGPVGSQIFFTAVAVVAAYYTAGLASEWFLSSYFSSTTWTVVEGTSISLAPVSSGGVFTAASIVGGVAGGSVGGGIAAGLQGGNPLSGALTGGLSGGVFAGLGSLTSGWDPVLRSAAFGVAGG